MPQQPEPSWQSLFEERRPAADPTQTMPLSALLTEEFFGGVRAALRAKKVSLLRGAAGPEAKTFDLEWFRDALARLDREQPNGAQLRASFSQGGARATPFVNVRYAQLSTLVAAGATICVTNIHLADARLQTIVAAAKGELGFCGGAGVNCYFSPDGGGFHAHWDARAANAIQLSGDKTWRYAPRPAAAFPLVNATYKDGGADYSLNRGANRQAPKLAVEHQGESEFCEVTLRPGDVLSLPAGTWHSARGHGHSLAFNVYFQHRSFVDVVAQWLGEEFAGNEAWRSGLPAGVPDDPAAADEARRYIAGRLAELRSALERSDDVVAGFEPLWLRSMVTDVSTTRTTPATPCTTPLQPEQPLRVDRTVPMLCRVVRGDDGSRAAVLMHGDCEIAVDEPAIGLFEHLCTEDTFAARTAMGWSRAGTYAWSSVRALLETCEAQGVLHRVEASHREVNP